MAIGITDVISIGGGLVGGLFGGGSRKEKRRIREQLKNALKSLGVREFGVTSDDNQRTQRLLAAAKINPTKTVAVINAELDKFGRELSSLSNFEFNRMIRNVEQAALSGGTAAQIAGGVASDSPTITGGLSNVLGGQSLPMLAILAVAGFIIFQVGKG